MKRLLALILLLVLFQGCSGKKQAYHSIFKTKDSNNVENNYQQSVKLILEYKEKLNKRNPRAYNKELSTTITDHLKHSEDILYLYTKKTKFTTYSEYLNFAFNTDIDVKNRNDYLILGLYTLIHSAYSINKNHKFTALEYNREEIQKAYKNLRILQWKIKYAKDKNGNYLFLTWQNNWQIELLNRYNKTKIIDYASIKDLKYIKNGTESLFDNSNSSYELIIDKILFYLEDSVSKTDMNAGEVFVDVIKVTTMFI